MIYYCFNSDSTFFYERRTKCQKIFQKLVTLAWSQPANICARLTEYLKKILHSSQFVDRHKQSTNEFIRIRLLSFQTLFLFFINFIKGSYQDEFDHYFKALFRLDVPIKYDTKMVLSLVRKKLKYDSIIEFNRHLLESFYDHFKTTTQWNGFNLLTTDGSTLKLFKYENIRDHFGIMKPNNKPACVMARVSQIFDAWPFQNRGFRSAIMLLLERVEKKIKQKLK